MRWVFIATIASFCKVILCQASGSTKSLYIRSDIGGNFYLHSPATTAAGNNSDMVSPDSSISSSMGYDLGLGYQIYSCLRTDLTFTYRTNIDISVLDNVPEIGKGTLRNYTIMGNLYYDLDYFKSNFIPYLSGGIGFCSFKGTKSIYWPVVQQYEFGRTTNNFAWEVGAGLSYRFSKNVLIDLSYQFLGLFSAKYTGKYNQPPVGSFNASLTGAPTQFKNIYNNQIQIGLRFYVW